MKQQKLLAAILCAVTPLSYATTGTLDEIVVTATRIAQPLKQSLNSTTVITRQDIQNSQAADVTTILRSVAGVEISQTGGMGKATSLFLRGSESTQVLVLLDGVRINSATLGTTSIQDLMLDQIERIEVVRGNVSSLYGSEAIGGVVQIFTKRGRGTPSFNASGGLGSLATQRVSAGFGGVIEATDFSVQASFFKTSGVSAKNPALAPAANPSNDGYRNASLSANVHHAFNTDNSLSASLFNSRGNNQYDAGVNPANIDTNEDIVSKFSLASDNRFSDSWQSHLQLAQGVDDNQNWTNGISGFRAKTTNRQITWQNTVQFNSNNQLLLGAENLVQNVASNTLYTVTQRTTNSLFAGYTGNYGAHQVQANLRQDHNSQYGTADTGLLGYGFTFNEVWRGTASYSTAFRAPTFNDLYWPLSFGYQGNPNLNPEYAHNAELGMHYAANNQHVDAVYFDNRIRDMIVINQTFTGPVNLKQARIDGVEVSYAGQFGDTGVRATLTSQNPRDVSSGLILPRRARQHGNVGVTQNFGAWQVGGEWLNSGERMDGIHTLASYNVVNLTAGYALSKELKLALRVDNLTNQNDATAYSYNPLGRTLFVGLNYRQ